MRDVTDKDLGWKKFMADLDKAKIVEVAVGVHSGEKNTEGDDLVSIAARNELGTEKSPARSFMAQTFDKNLNKVQKLMDHAAVQIEGGMSAYVALGRVGQRYSEMTKQTIATFTDPPNAPSTIAQKGRDEPLRDTYSMMKSIRHVVRKRSK